MSRSISFFLFLTSLLFFSCQEPSEISKDFNCKKNNVKNLEVVIDVKNQFSIQLPKKWKINLYQDEVQSSIYAADITKQLTEAALLDVTFINKKIEFTDLFLLKQEQEYLSKNLIKIKSKEFTILEKPSIYILYKGKKGNYNYQICNTFIKVNESNFIHAKVEIYGDSLVNQRLCNSISFIENIQIH